MRETPIFLLPVKNLTSASCSPTLISCKMQEPPYPIRCRNFGDSVINMGQTAYFLLRMRKTALFLLPVKNLTSRRVPRPQFLMTRGNFDDTWTFKADIAFFIFALILRTSGSKMAIFRGKIGEGVGRYWPPTNSFLLLGVYTSVSNLVKIDK